MSQQKRGEARAHRFAMWRGTDDGKAFGAWQDASDSLIAVLNDRQNRWQAAWVASVSRLVAAIPDADRFKRHQ